MASTKHNEKMKAFYERLKANGKHTTQAQTAVIRKLIVVAHSLNCTKRLQEQSQYRHLKHFSNNWYYCYIF